MLTNGEPLPELDCTNLVQTWPVWRDQFIKHSFQFRTIGLIDEFLKKIGLEGQKMYRELFSNDDPSTFDIVLEAFDGYIQKIADLNETFNFNKILQKKNQSFADFESKLRAQMQNCHFKCSCGESYAERMLRDRFISGVNSKELQTSLLGSREVNLNQIIEKCKQFVPENNGANLNLVKKKVGTKRQKKSPVEPILAKKLKKSKKLEGTANVKETKNKKSAENAKTPVATPKSSKTTKKLSAEKPGTPSKSVADTDLSKPKTPLDLQRERVKNVIIHLQSDFFKKFDQSLEEAFQKICEQLKASISIANDVKNIERIEDSLFVTFKTNKSRADFLAGAGKKEIWSNDILHGSTKSYRIDIMPNMTPHYKEMWLHASDMKRKSQLYSFELRADGLYVKRYENDIRGTYCLYKSDIENLVHKK